MIDGARIAVMGDPDVCAAFACSTLRELQGLEVVECYASPAIWKADPAPYHFFLLAVRNYSERLIALLSRRKGRVMVVGGERSKVIQRHGVYFLGRADTQEGWKAFVQEVVKVATE